ncbi:MAG: hypothetical protein P4L85_12400 [Paludisphaera borealis]|uniref:hypothetical protein n=1 Tax=Paludisphaera borealis TaxID=1387353 RepID=UPI00283FB2CE|nr:hypothetical protein [Paludisphaera borealis]MDR3620145.1 hypothetical protein [Paludisphaera borealis]
MSLYRLRAALAGLVLTIFASGCGDDMAAPVEKSPHAPTKAQIDEMTNSVLRKGKTAKAPAEDAAKAPAEAPKS